MKTTLKTLITSPAYFDQDAVRAFEAFSHVTVKQFSREELLKNISEYHILAIRVDTKVDKELLTHAKNLKVIATATTGTDHIDIAFAKENGIEVFSLTGANTTATAEHALALLLSLSRKIPAAHTSLLHGNWDRASFIGTQLSGKKLGVVGFGRIGREIAARARAFGMQILAYDPYLKDADFANNHATKMDMNALLQEADVITLHVLLTDETRGFINAKKLALLKPTAILLNCSRGEVIVEQDLVHALQHKKIAGAALDVFSHEPLSQESELISYAKSYDNLVLTPHIVGSTWEAIHDAGLAVAAQTKAFFEKSRN
ncbi:hydroxyacid dehydrogenase [Candidatus Woesearchaeota archaeon]|nr:hydroxyacid dehydrogenase [Candidatus Woesearchaeota archaeon]